MFFEATFFNQLQSHHLFDVNDGLMVLLTDYKKHKTLLNHERMLVMFIVGSNCAMDLDDLMSDVDCERVMSRMKRVSSSLNVIVNPTTKCARFFATCNFDILCERENA